MKRSFIYLIVLLCACGAGERKSESKTEMAVRAYDHSGDASAVAEEAPAEEAYPESTDGTAGNNAMPVSSGTPIPDVAPKLIRTADLRFQVTDLNTSSDKIEAMAKKHKAFISNSSLNSYNGSLNNVVSIRVPSANFDELLKDVCTESIFMERKNVSTQDVTEEYVDIETRLKTKKEVEARYIEILRTKAKTVADVLAAEEQIRIIREEIEAREGRLKYLSNQVGYSTITVEMFQQTEYKEAPVAVQNTFTNRLGDSFSQGWDAIVDIILTLITGWPLILFLLVLYILLRKRIKHGYALMKTKLGWK